MRVLSTLVLAWRALAFFETGVGVGAPLSCTCLVDVLDIPRPCFPGAAHPTLDTRLDLTPLSVSSSREKRSRPLVHPVVLPLCHLPNPILRSTRTLVGIYSTHVVRARRSLAHVTRKIDLLDRRSIHRKDGAFRRAGFQSRNVSFPTGLVSLWCCQSYCTLCTLHTVYSTSANLFRALVLAYLATQHPRRDQPPSPRFASPRPNNPQND